MPRIAAWSGILFASSCLFAAARAEEVETFPLDPVELVAGREVPGDPSREARHERFAYHFATDANLEAFKREPGRFAIQLGGACARMGPLSGSGRIDLHAVHDGRLYLFASEACRKTFLASPDRLLESDDPAPEGPDAARALGKELVERAVAAAGGAQAVDSARGYRQVAQRKVSSGGKDHLVRRVLTLAFPDRARQEETWSGEYLSGWVKCGDDAFAIVGKEKSPIAASQRRAFDRLLDRNPLVILRARTRPDFQAVALDASALDGRPIDRVRVAFDGTATTLGIDRETGLVVSLSYRGRGPDAFLTDVEKRLSDFRKVRDLILPATTTTSFGGVIEPDAALTFESLEVNPQIDPALFQH